MQKVKLTIGTKVLHNVYSGWEWQPSARLAFTTSRNTIWAAVSRAVRTPSRLDVDYFLPMTPQPPNVPSVAGGPNFRSENLVAYELGYRLHTSQRLSLSASTFYHDYQNVYSVEALPNTLTYQIQNGSKAESWGFEFSGDYQVLKSWKLRGGYTYFNKDIRALPGRNFNPDYLGNDPKHIALLQSIVDLPLNLQFDLVGRYATSLKKTFATAAVPTYFTFDARLAYAYKSFELSVVGQNLAHRNHVEFGTILLPRSVYVKLSARF
jgi:iron complex outermembrane receptor protein